MPLTSGTQLGPYEIQSPIGAGGMGEVYRARDARLNRDVAIKILPASFSADAERLQRFAQESRAAAALNHPNILSIFDIGEANGASDFSHHLYFDFDQNFLGAATVMGIGQTTDDYESVGASWGVWGTIRGARFVRLGGVMGAL